MLLTVEILSSLGGPWCALNILWLNSHGTHLVWCIELNMPFWFFRELHFIKIFSPLGFSGNHEFLQHWCHFPKWFQSIAIKHLYTAPSKLLLHRPHIFVLLLGGLFEIFLSVKSFISFSASKMCFVLPEGSNSSIEVPVPMLVSYIKYKYNMTVRSLSWFDSNLYY